MEENNNQIHENKDVEASKEKSTASAKASKKNKDKKNDKAFMERVNGIGKSLKEHFKDYKSEFDKIIWPNRKELTKQTVTVIATSLLFGAIVFVIDSIFTAVYTLIVQNFASSKG